MGAVSQRTNITGYDNRGEPKPGLPKMQAVDATMAESGRGCLMISAKKVSHICRAVTALCQSHLSFRPGATFLTVIKKFGG